MNEPDRRTVDAEREPNFLLARAEKRALRAIALRLPRWILPDDLTALGVLSAVGICAAYVLIVVFTAYPLGLVKAIPFTVHGTIELILSPLLIALPWLVT